MLHWHGSRTLTEASIHLTPVTFFNALMREADADAGNLTFCFPQEAQSPQFLHEYHSETPAYHPENTANRKNKILP